VVKIIDKGKATTQVVRFTVQGSPLVLFFIFLEVIDESTNCITCPPNFFIKIFEFLGRYVFLRG